MKDFLGNELQPGDEIVFVEKTGTGGVELSLGKLWKIERGNACILRKYSDGTYMKESDLLCNRCKGKSIMKLNPQQSNERF